MTIEHFRYPTHQEIEANVRAARRYRAEAIAHLLRGAVRACARLIARGASAGVRARARPRALPSDVSSAKEHPMPESFWRSAAASLPPHVQQRYASLFEAAEMYEPVIEFVVTARSGAHSALARCFRGIADTLRNVARGLDLAARRLTPTR